jgi:N-acetylneuraminic acid mutarotase
MSVSLRPLLWKVFEKTDSDDIWPKKTIGPSLVYVEKFKKYVLIGGNFNAFENSNKNVQLNREILSGTMDNFNKLDNAKRSYLTDSVYNNNQSSKSIEVYIYELHPERRWYKVASSGRVPRARSFHRCISMSIYNIKKYLIDGFVFCFGGVELGSKGENHSLNELYVFNPQTYEWKLISCEKSPCDRCDFNWVKLAKSAFLYGGAASPSEFYFDDMWVFKYDECEFIDNKKDIQKDYWFEINQLGKKPGKIRAYSMEYSVIDCCLYLFGGQDALGNNKGDMYKFDISKYEWELVKTKGKPPGDRCYHEMALINKDNFVIFGGFLGSLSKIETMYSDVFLYNIQESVWVEPVIGGIQPCPRFGFGFCTNDDFNKLEIMIFGGYSKDNEVNTNSKNIKIYNISENGNFKFNINRS